METRTHQTERNLHSPSDEGTYFWFCTRSKAVDKVHANEVMPQAAQDLSVNHTRETIWHRIIRVFMRFSTRYPWRWLNVKISIKMVYFIPYVLFAPGVVILPI